MASSSSNEFGWSLLRLLTEKQDEGNLFLSPFSISVALAMTQLGARDKTATCMAKGLCWKTDGMAIHKEFQQYIELLQKPKETFTLRSANRIFVEESYPFQEAFLNQAKELYFAEPVPSNFKQNAESERIKINKWVEQETEQKIKDLIGPGVLSEVTRMVLVNAIYFKGEWQHKFKSNDTFPRSFNVSPSTSKTVPMMTMSKQLPYYKAKDYAVVELPYKGDHISMVIFLPDEKFGLKKLEQRLTMKEIQETISKLKKSMTVDLSLPKFEMNSSFTLKAILSQLGMGEAFDSCADFSGMTGNKDLFISEVVHKAFLKVDEEGTVAAAATAVMMALCCAMSFDSVTFDVDHPFLVVIRDKTNDMILFMGRVTEPPEAEAQ